LRRLVFYCADRYQRLDSRLLFGKRAGDIEQQFGIVASHAYDNGWPNADSNTYAGTDTYADTNTYADTDTNANANTDPEQRRSLGRGYDTSRCHTRRPR
jgi:hypothetical protein